MGLLLIVAAVICELLAAFGIGAKWEIQLVPFGLALFFLAGLVGPVTALVVRQAPAAAPHP